MNTNPKLVSCICIAETARTNENTVIFFLTELNEPHTRISIVDQLYDQVPWNNYELFSDPMRSQSG